MNKKTDEKKTFKPLVALNTSICIALLIVISSAFIASGALREIFTGNVLANAAGNIETSEIVDFVSGYVTEDDITEEQLEKVIIEMDAVGFLRKNIENYSEFLITGKNFKPMTSDTVIAFLDENKELIRTETKFKLTDADKEDLSVQLNGILEPLNEYLNNNINYLSFEISLPFMIIMCVIMLLIFAQWFFVYIKNSIPVMRLFKIYSTVLLAVSFMFGVLCLFSKIIFEAVFTQKYRFFTPVIWEAKNAFLLKTGIILIIALCLVIIYLGADIAVKLNELKKRQGPVPAEGFENISDNAEFMENSGISDGEKASDDKKDASGNKSVAVPELQASPSPLEIVYSDDDDDDYGPDKESEDKKEENNKEEAVTDETAPEPIIEDIEEKQDKKKIAFCTNCGNKFREGAVFCDICGSKLHDD